MYHVSAQGVDERMIDLRYYYYYYYSAATRQYFSMNIISVIFSSYRHSMTVLDGECTELA